MNAKTEVPTAKIKSKLLMFSCCCCLFLLLLFLLLFFKPGVGWNTVLHASPAARNSAFLLSGFPIHSTSFVSNLLVTSGDMCLEGNPDFHLQ